jgi:hypothetical protein
LDGWREGTLIGWYDGLILGWLVGCDVGTELDVGTNELSAGATKLNPHIVDKNVNKSKCI